MPGTPDESDDNAGGQRAEPNLQLRVPKSASAQLFGKKRAENDEVQTARAGERWRNHPVGRGCKVLEGGEHLSHPEQSDAPNKHSRVTRPRYAPDSHLADTRA